MPHSVRYSKYFNPLNRDNWSKPGQFGPAIARNYLTRRERQYERQKKRESAESERRSQIRLQLLSTLKRKYGGGNPSLVAIIEREVDALLSSASLPLKSNDIAILESNIQKYFREDVLPGFTYNHPMVSPVITRPLSARPPATGRPASACRPLTARALPRSSRPSTPVSPRPPATPTLSPRATRPQSARIPMRSDAPLSVTGTGVGGGDDNWVLLQTYHAVKEEETEEEKARLREEEMQEVVLTRQEQRLRHQLDCTREQWEKDRLHRSIEADTESYRREEQELREKERQRSMENMRALKEQIAENERIRMQEEGRTRKRELYESDRLKQRIAEEEEEERLQKQQQRKELQSLLVDNDTKRVEKYLMSERERAEDIQMMKDYKDRLDREEREREEYFRRIYEKQQRNIDRNMECRKEEFLNEQAVQNRIDRYAEERNARLDAEEREHQKQAREANLQQSHDLEDQMRLHQLRYGQGREADSAYQRALDSELREALRREEAKQRAVRRRNEDVQSFLRKQMEEFKARDASVLTEQERKMNRQLLEEIARDPVLQGKIGERLGRGVRSGRRYVDPRFQKNAHTRLF